MTPQLERGVPHPDDDRPGLLLRCRFHPGLVEDLKAIEPPGDRAWRPDLEGWWVAPAHEDAVVAFVVLRLGSVLVLSEDGGSDELVEADGSRSRQERLEL